MISAIIVAAGRGTRMGPERDKLFLEVAGRPLVAHTWQRVDTTPCIEEVVLVVREGWQSAFEELAKEFKPRKAYRLVIGGRERHDSVWHGLEALAPGCEWVAIQDGARPCTPPALIAATLDAARQTGAAVAAQRVTDTIKQSEDGAFVTRNLDRRQLWAVQTPQSFRVEVIRRALSLARQKGLHLTDDTAACELIGQPVRLVESAAPNPKVTLPADVPYIELLLRGERAD